MKVFMILVCLTISACVPKQDSLVLPRDTRIVESRVTEIYVSHNFHYEDSLQYIPKDIEVNYVFNQPIKLEDFFLTLSIQGVNIVVDIETFRYEDKGEEDKGFNPGKQFSLGQDGGGQSDPYGPPVNNERTIDKNKYITLPFYNGSLRSLLYSLGKVYGLFYEYSDGTLIVSDTRTSFFEIAYPSQESAMAKILKNFGVTDYHYDQFTGKIIFTSNYSQFYNLKSFLDNTTNLAWLEYRLVFLEIESGNQETAGFDWSNFTLMYDSDHDLSEYSLNLFGSPGGMLSGQLTSQGINLESVLNHLKSVTRYEVIQTLTLQTMTGVEADFSVIRTIPYVSEYKITAISDTENRIAQDVEFQNINQGVEVKLTGNLRSNLVYTELGLEMSELINFETVTTGKDFEIKRPVINKRVYNTLSMMKPGAVFNIGQFTYKNLDYSKRDNFFIPFVSRSEKTINISILGSVDVTRIVFNPQSGI